MSTDILPTALPGQSAEHLDGLSPRGTAASAVHADEIVVLSAAGKAAPVAWRERLAVDADHDGAAAAELPGTGTIVEAMVLSTCGRFEIYAVASDADRAERELLRWVARRSGSPVETVAGRVRTLRGRAAARHVIATAAGLRSPVLGEHEILGQVRRARDRAARSGAAGPILDRLVVEALRAGGRVRATTPLGRGSVSVLSVGVQVVVETCPGAGRRALVLGGSRTAAAARDRLLAGGWAVTAAADLPSPLGTFLRAFDVIVTCTGTSGTVVSAPALADAAARRGGTPLLVLDLSVPRDVDPRARLADGVLLYDVDALGAVAAPAVASRRAGIPAAERIVDAELTHFEAWRADRMLAPTLKALRGHVRDLVVDALADAAPSGPAAGAGADARTVERVVGRLLHAPTRRLREAAADGSGAHRALLVQLLFGLDDDLAALRARG